MRLLVTGSRDWPENDFLLIHAVLHGYDDSRSVHGPLTVVVGDCPTGVDKIVHEWCHLFEIAHERHKADWRTCHPGHPAVPCRHRPRSSGRCPAAGPRRNQAMVAAGADRGVAFAYGEIENSNGTYDCRERALDADIPIDTIERWR